MKKLVEQVDGEGFEALMGEVITVFCLNYFYTGKLVGVNDSCILLEFLFQNLKIKIYLVRIIVFPAGGKLKFHLFRNEGESINLPMRMCYCYPDFLSSVLEYENIIDKIFTSKFDIFTYP